MFAPRIPPPAMTMRRGACALRLNGRAPATAIPPNNCKSVRRCIRSSAGTVQPADNALIVSRRTALCTRNTDHHEGTKIHEEHDTFHEDICFVSLRAFVMIRD